MPKGAVYVGRPSKWENPFTIDAAGSRSKAVRLFRLYITQHLTRRAIEKVVGRGAKCPPGKNDLGIYGLCLTAGVLRHDCLGELRGKDLACWCPLDQPCHADVLLEIANGKAAARA